MNNLLILIILIYNKMPIDGTFISPKQYEGIQSQRFRRDSPLVGAYPIYSQPGYVTSNNPAQTSLIICPVDQSSYSLQSIVINNPGSFSRVTLKAQDVPNSGANTGKARGSVLVFDNLPTSRCYTLNFPSAVSPVMDLQVQFIYNSTNNAGARSVAPGYGYGNYLPPPVSNQNAACGSVSCQNGGICQYMGASGYQCQCGSSGLWLGNDCSKPNPCIQSPCYNGGQCYYRPDATYYCQCRPGYTGSNCQNALAVGPPTTYNPNDQCFSLRPCQNGGTCVSRGNQGGYTCTCPPGYIGVNCEAFSYLTNPSTIPSKTCGQSSLKIPLSLPGFGRIVGGTPVKNHTWPWIVSIQTASGQHFCGGTLVDAYHVITAAHCFNTVGTSPNNFKIVAGLLNMRNPYIPGVQQLAIERIYRHEGFNPTLLINDITVIKLRTPALINDAVSPICLPNGDGAQDPQVGQSVLIAGWGYTSSITKQIANDLQEATIQILNMYGDLYGGPGCSRWSNGGYQLDNRQQICAMSQDTRSDSCQGDSGGPLIGAVESSWYLFGIVSYGDSICGSSTAAGVYTRVSGYAAWIQQKLQL